MLSLNILSGEPKKEVKLNNIYRSILNIFYLAIILLSIYSIIFLLGKLVIVNYYIDTINETTPIQKNSKDYSKKVELINKKINNISQIQNDYIEWSGFFTYLSNIENKDISLSKISIDKKTKKVNLDGIAKNREGLLEFTEALEKTTFLNNITFPPKSLLLKKDININITCDLISYDFQ